MNLGLSASYDDLKTDSTASDSLKKQSGTFEEIATSYGFTYDQRDRAFMPTSGSILSFGQSFPIHADKKFIYNRLNTSFYKSFSENIVGATKFCIVCKWLSEDDVRISKRQLLSQKDTWF